MAISEAFQEKVNLMLEDIREDVLYYEQDEYWMIQAAYEYVEFYATRRRLLNTCIALPLARGLHNGEHRKSVLIKGDMTYRLPYVIHPLMVCKMLIELQPALSDYELDLLLASALCHDMIEDIPFMDHGKELMIQYHLNRKVYDTVLAVSKKKNATQKELKEHFDELVKNKLAVLVKLSDRGNNVEDLYNMSSRKVHEYVAETENFILPMCDYAKEHYPELIEAIMVLENKIRSLTDAAKILVDRYEDQEKQMQEEIDNLRAENDELRKKWRSLWKVEMPAEPKGGWLND